MDLIAYQAAAVAIAGIVASLLQERFAWQVTDGRAVALAVGIALAIGVAAVAHVGINGIGAPQTDVFGFAVEVLKVATAVLVASQAAFRVIVKPVTAAG